MTHASEPFIPEIGQAAFGAPWQEYTMPDFVRAGLAELGEAVTAGSSSGGDPTENSGASFGNDVFALRAYCWCDGESVDHAAGCPPNFEHRASGFAASWYKYLGRGSSISGPITEHDFEQLLVDCRASLPGSGVLTAREQLNKAAAAVLPAGAFVESSIEGDDAWLRVWLPWPAHIAAAPDPDPSTAVAPSVASAEGGLRGALAQIGWTMASDETEFHLTAPFPPFGDGDPQDAEASKYYRQLSDDELRAEGWDDPSEVFISDRFVLIAHSGVNLFRTAHRVQAEVDDA